MRCGTCGNEMKEGWKFCPVCGSAPEKRQEGLFEDVFERMEREMKDMSKAFERNFEVVDLSPFFSKPARGSGFSIRITQSGGGKPKVDVKTFGDVNRKEVENEVSRFGLKDKIGKAFRPAAAKQEPAGVRLENAKTTHEPETSVRSVAGRIIAEVKMPDVKKAEDIEIRPLDSSIEIRAIAGDKAYFKILTKPPRTTVIRREFAKGILTIEFS